MIRALHYASDGTLRTDLTPEEFRAALGDERGLLWVDFETTPAEADAPILLDTFGFHPLAVDDALQESHVPKLDEWDQYLYLVLHAVVFEAQAPNHLDTHELDVFLGPNYLVTHHDQSIAAVDRVWSACQREARHLKDGPDHVLYRIADEVVASFMPVVEKMDETIDQIEDEVFDRPSPRVLERILALKHSTVHLRRILAPQREVLNKLARDDYHQIDPRDRVYFRDVYDHLVRLYDIVEGMRDLVGGTLDTYLSVINNRMNDIIKTLTILTTMFLPLTFVAGFFGMNFFQPTTPLDIWTGAPAFVMTLIIMLIVPIAMYLWIRRHGWL